MNKSPRKKYGFGFKSPNFINHNFKNHMNNIPLRRTPSRNQMNNIPLRRTPSRNRMNNIPLKSSPSRNQMNNISLRRTPSRNRMNNIPLKSSPSRNQMNNISLRRSRNHINANPNFKIKPTVLDLLMESHSYRRPVGMYPAVSSYLGYKYRPKYP